jgi:hypothetical protein
VDQIASSTLSIGFSTSAGPISAAKPVDDAVRQLHEEWLAQQALFQSQPVSVQRFLQAQAAQLAQALLHRLGQAEIVLPERVRVTGQPQSKDEMAAVPSEFRRQMVAGLLGRLPVKNIRTAVRQRLTQLEQSPYQAVAVSARLLRYATVNHIVHDMLPAGQVVTYLVAEGDTIPTVPAADPALPVAQRFAMPQWVAFNNGQLLLDSDAQAEACIASMQQYLNTLHLAVSLAPYIYADEEYQHKHYGVLGQLVNQGRALAHYQTGVVIRKIHCYAEAGELNLGFSLSLPYFDDQTLEMKMYDFEVIPPGRIMFLPSLVWRAARREQERVQQDARLNETTRLRLRAELEELALAFDTRPAATGCRS